MSNKLLKILCKNCKSEFEYKGELKGQVEYVKCQNVFKLVYDSKVICPNCMNVVKLESEGRIIVGTPVQEIAKRKRAQEGTRISESEETKTRMSLLAKAFLEIKKNLQKALDDKEEKEDDEDTETYRESKTKGWHLKASKKGWLKKLGLTMILISFAMFPAKMISDSSAETACIEPSTISETPVAASVAYKDLNGKENMLNLEELKKILSEGKSKRTEETGTEEPLSKLKKDSKAEKKRLIKKLNISSSFGMRDHPIKKKRLFHAGIDIARSYRAPIKALMDGKVVFAGYKAGYGNMVIIKHKNGITTYYSHNSKNAVLKNETVKKGQIIGYIGTTGLTTGPHYHFEVRKNGTPIDPLDFIVKNLGEGNKATI